MVQARGRNLKDDLRCLVDSEAFYDICIKCSDGPVHAYKGILASRSNVFYGLLTSGPLPKNDDKDVLEFDDINIVAMRIILEYIHTGELSNSSLKVETVVDTYHAALHFQLDNLQVLIINFTNAVIKNNNVEFAAGLLSCAVAKITPPANDGFFRMLVYYISARELDRIPYRGISWKALQTLLKYTSNSGNIPFCSTEYSVLRYAILHAAHNASDHDTYEWLKNRLPTEETLAEHIPPADEPQHNERLNITKVRQAIEGIMPYIDLRRVEGEVIAKVIEPLGIVPFDSLYDAYRHQTVFRSALPSKRGTNQPTNDAE